MRRHEWPGQPHGQLPRMRAPFLQGLGRQRLGGKAPVVQGLGRQRFDGVDRPPRRDHGFQGEERAPYGTEVARHAAGHLAACQGRGGGAGRPQRRPAGRQRQHGPRRRQRSAGRKATRRARAAAKARCRLAGNARRGPRPAPAGLGTTSVVLPSCQRQPSARIRGNGQPAAVDNGAVARSRSTPSCKGCGSLTSSRAPFRPAPTPRTTSRPSGPIRRAPAPAATRRSAGTRSKARGGLPISARWKAPRRRARTCRPPTAARAPSRTAAGPRPRPTGGDENAPGLRVDFPTPQSLAQR